MSLEENLVQAGLTRDLPLGQFLADNFRSLGILPFEDCEDRSLNMVELKPLFPRTKELSKIATRGGGRGQGRGSHFKSIFVLEEPEINIGPDRSLYKVPFAALSEKERAEYLSETHRIRVIPSLTTLKMIQNSPEDYHSNTGALIIGNPKVGRRLH